LNILTADLSGIINSYIFVGNGVRYYINLTPEFKTEDMNRLIEGLIGTDDKVVSNFALLKDTTIYYVYPYEKNKSGLGTDLAKLEDQREPVETVKKTGKTFITGPVNLVEGGRGIIIRMIINAGGAGGKDYWGQVAEVLSYENMAEKAKIEAYFKNNYLRIYEQNVAEKDPHILWSNHDAPMKSPIVKEINFTQSKWILEATPKDGWSGRTVIFYSLLFLGAIASIFCGLYIYNTVGKREVLARMVREKTEALEESLIELKTTQDQLIEQEKMASLGALVSGIAHEINTPLGVGISTASYLESISEKSRRKLEENTLTKGEFISFLENLESGLKTLDLNLFRAAELVKNFKQIAVDQNYEVLTEFCVHEYLDVVTQTLSHELKKHAVKIDLEGSSDIRVMSYPGAFSRIFTNLIMNSIVHGFKGKVRGHIWIRFALEEGMLNISYSDDGKGIPAEVLPKIYDPFFTTNREAGGSGLGLNIVYNLVVGKFGGKIKCESEEGEGTTFVISIPLHERNNRLWSNP